MQVKIHHSYRIVVAVCDSDLIGKKFEEGNRQLDIPERFYKDTEMNEEQVIDLFARYSREDATFNIVGPEAVRVALNAEIIAEDHVGHIQGVPFVLVF